MVTKLGYNVCMASDNAQFKIGEHVVYPLQGVGVIKDIRERMVRDVPVMYYVIYIDMSDMTVSIPVGKVAESGVRALVPALSRSAASTSPWRWTGRHATR